jgi:hypothetical protein
MLSCRDLFPNDDPGPSLALHLRVMVRLAAVKIRSDEILALVECGHLDNTNDPARVQSESCGH